MRFGTGRPTLWLMVILLAIAAGKLLATDGKDLHLDPPQRLGSVEQR